MEACRSAAEHGVVEHHHLEVPSNIFQERCDRDMLQSAPINEEQLRMILRSELQVIEKLVAELRTYKESSQNVGPADAGARKPALPLKGDSNLEPAFDCPDLQAFTHRDPEPVAHIGSGNKPSPPPKGSENSLFSEGIAGRTNSRSCEFETILRQSSSGHFLRGESVDSSASTCSTWSQRFLQAPLSVFRFASIASKAAVRASLSIVDTRQRRQRVRKSSSRVSDVVDSSLFEGFIAVLIIGNAIFIGFEQEWRMQCHIAERAASCEPSAMAQTVHYMHVFFGVSFAVELLLRIAAGPFRFVFGVDRYWHVLDMLLVASALIDLVGKERSQLSHLRIFRIVRGARVLRVVRVFKVFSVLRKMVNSLLHSFISLFWLLILLVTVIYIFSIGFMQAAMDPRTKADMPEELVEMYGSIGVSMLTLFQAITGGIDWADAMGPLLAIGVGWGALFIGFIMFNTFAVMNVVTGVFVDRALEIAAGDREELIDDQLAEQIRMANDFELFFEEHFSAWQGQVKRSELLKVLQCPKAVAFLKTLDLDIDQSSLLELIDMLDSQSVDEIDISDFIQCCLRVKGPAKSLDFLYINSRIDVVLNHVARIESKVCGGSVPDLRPKKLKMLLSSTSRIGRLSIRRHSVMSRHNRTFSNSAAGWST